MNIMIVGVGGQGTLLASRIIGNVVIEMGYDVKLSEVHGMSQRGGSVVTYVKYSDKVYSPIVDKGEADIILAFEMLEAYRALPYLKIGGHIIANTRNFLSKYITFFEKGRAFFIRNKFTIIKEVFFWAIFAWMFIIIFI